MIHVPDNDRRDNMPADEIDNTRLDDPIAVRRKAHLKRRRLLLAGNRSTTRSSINARIKFIEL